MEYKYFKLFALCILSITTCYQVSAKDTLDVSKASVYPIDKEAETVLLNGSWDFKYIPGGNIPSEDASFYEPNYTSKEWGKIEVPSNWEIQGKAEPNYGTDLKEGIGLYRTTFEIPEHLSNKNIFIRFEGVLYAYELYVNGKFVGEWDSAFNSKQFDLTPFINQQGENTLAVKVMTHTDRGTHLFDISDAWSLSGIFRDVVLFSIPDVNFSDMKFHSDLTKNDLANITIETEINNFNSKNSENLTLSGQLFNPKGERVHSFTHPVSFGKESIKSITSKATLESPDLWTAETPHLYEIKLTLNEGRKVIQSIKERVGIRDITIEDGVLMVNNSAVTLKGVNMHEIHPERGRALTDKDRMKDLKLAKQANVNFIRTAHYPHNSNFYDMCDSLGFYVFSEIPFNYRPFGVFDNLEYLPDLKKRAKSTIERDKNHPSIIAWTVGNENNYAEIYREVGEYVALKDSTRPRVFPQSPNQFKRDGKKQPKHIFNALAPHYLLPEELDSLGQQTERPVIMTEYAHSLGLSSENLEENWKVVRKYPRLAGGAIWLWSDQGIKRKRGTQEFLNDDHIEGVWVDSTTYYDGHNVNGTDGLVYSNRYPQIDYYMVQKVYSPIWIPDKKVNINSGRQRIQIDVENRFDFKSLKDLRYTWTLKHYKTKIKSGEGTGLKILPQTTGSIELPISIPDTNPGEFTLTIDFFNGKGTSLYKTSIQLQTNKNGINYQELKTNNRYEADKVTQYENENAFHFVSEKNSFSFGKEGEVLIQDHNTADSLLHGYPVLRVGRKPTITLAYQGGRYQDKGWFDENFYWDPYLLQEPELRDSSIQKTEDGYKIVATYRWNRPNKEKEYIEGDVIYSLYPNGRITCSYDLKLKNTTNYFMELGLGFSLPSDFYSFSWLGDGPYVSVPGKTKYNTRDVWSLKKNDIRFNGNRLNVDLALFNSLDKTGLGIIANKSDLGVELVNDQIVFTQNSVVSGFGSKVNFPKYIVQADKIKSLEGEFDIVITRDDSELFKKVFSPVGEINVEQPFLKSYGF